MGKRGGGGGGGGRRGGGGSDGRGTSSGAVAAAAALSNRANQLNPEKVEYWQSRGYPGRPDNVWRGVVEQRRAAGQFEHAANLAAASNPQERAALGRDVKRVESAVKQALGGNARVYKGGSQGKHTDVRGSDLDLKIRTERPLTDSDKSVLGAALADQFGVNCVDALSNPRIHKVRGEFGDVDVVPNQATYFPQGFHTALPKKPFGTNHAARLAVRGVKDRAQQDGRHLSGYGVEQAVLQEQQRHPGADGLYLANRVWDHL